MSARCSCHHHPLLDRKPRVLPESADFELYTPRHSRGARPCRRPGEPALRGDLDTGPVADEPAARLRREFLDLQSRGPHCVEVLGIERIFRHLLDGSGPRPIPGRVAGVGARRTMPPRVPVWKPTDSNQPPGLVASVSPSIGFRNDPAFSHEPWSQRRPSEGRVGTGRVVPAGVWLMFEIGPFATIRDRANLSGFSRSAHAPARES